MRSPPTSPHNFVSGNPGPDTKTALQQHFVQSDCGASPPRPEYTDPDHRENQRVERNHETLITMEPPDGTNPEPEPGPELSATQPHPPEGGVPTDNPVTEPDAQQQQPAPKC